MTKFKYYAGGKRHAAQDESFIESLDKKLWSTGDADEWDSCWYTGMPKASYFKDLTDRQSINHIPGNNSLTIKNRLHHTLSKAQARQYSDRNKQQYEFFPKIYDMPSQYHAFLKAADENPSQKWILKPKNSSRGRGIEVVTDIETVPSGARWMVQEYLSEPDLIDSRKYVLRLYVLITSIDPLQVYLYNEGFAKLASEPFTTDDFSNPYAHLTNPDINVHNDKVDEPVIFISLENYRKILSDRGEDKEKIKALFSRIHDLVTLTIIASREEFRARIERQKVNQHACYELLGLDCLIDKDLKPWILECNLSPSLETCSTAGEEADIESIIKNGVVRDMVGLRGLNQLDKRPCPSNFESQAAFIRANMDYEDKHCGEFSRLYPASNTVEGYMKYFVPLKSDLMAAQVVNPDVKLPDIYAHDMVPEMVTQENTLAIFDRGQGKYINLTAHESWLWVKLAMGISLGQIEDDFIQEFNSGDISIDPAEEQKLRAFPWDSVARWVEKNYVSFGQNAPVSGSENQTPSSQAEPDTVFGLKLAIGTIRVDLGCVDASLFSQIIQAYSRFTSHTTDASEVTLNITRGQGGFHIVKNGRIGKRLLRGEVIGELNRQLLALGLGDEYDLALDICTTKDSDQGLQVIINDDLGESEASFWTGLFVSLENRHFVTAELPCASVSSDTGEITRGSLDQLSFVSCDPKSGKLSPVSDPVEIMNGLSRKIITPNGNIPADLIRNLSALLAEA